MGALLLFEQLLVTLGQLCTGALIAGLSKGFCRTASHLSNGVEMGALLLFEQLLVTLGEFGPSTTVFFLLLSLLTTTVQGSKGSCAFILRGERSHGLGTRLTGRRSPCLRLLLQRVVQPASGFLLGKLGLQVSELCIASGGRGGQDLHQ